MAPYSAGLQTGVGELSEQWRGAVQHCMLPYSTAWCRTAPPLTEPFHAMRSMPCGQRTSGHAGTCVLNASTVHTHLTGSSPAMRSTLAATSSPTRRRMRRWAGEGSASSWGFAREHAALLRTVPFVIVSLTSRSR